jgi:hypothetical protein
LLPFMIHFRMRGMHKCEYICTVVLWANFGANGKV